MPLADIDGAGGLKMNKQSGWIVVVQEIRSQKWWPVGMFQPTRRQAIKSYLDDNSRYFASTNNTWAYWHKRGRKVVKATLQYENP